MSSTNSRSFNCSSPSSEPGSDYDMADLYHNDSGSNNGNNTTTNKPTHEKRGSWINRAMNAAGFKSSTNNHGGNNDAENEEEDESAKDKKEERVVKILRGVRNKLIAKGLVGKVFIDQGGGLTTRGVEVEIKEDDKLDVDYVENDPEVKRIHSLTDSCIDNLEKRCKKWEGCDFIPNVTLKRGYSIAFTSPFIAVLNWSMQINVEVTLSSLVKARKRREQNKTQDALAMGHMKLEDNGDKISVFHNRKQLFDNNSNNDGDNLSESFNSSNNSVINQARRRSSLA